MSLVKNLILYAIILSAIPIGLLISRFTEEEIKKGKLELKLLIIASAIAYIASSIIAFSGQPIARIASAFVFFLALTSFIKAKGLK
jgi:hypothetical protein